MSQPVIETEEQAATVEAVRRVTTRWYLAGPVRWRSFTLFLLAWIVCAWGASETRWLVAIATVIVAGAIGFWLLIPKSETRMDLKGWTILPLAIAFAAGLALAAVLTSLDEDLVVAAYGVWFASWLQFGLWLQFGVSRTQGGH